MALKKKLTKAEFEKLPPVLQAEYKKEGEDYNIDVEGGIEGNEEVLRAKANEKKEHAETKRLLHEAKEALAKAEGDVVDMLKGAVPKADVERLENSYKEKLKARETELTGEVKTLQKTLTAKLVDNVAMQLASEISTSPELILPHITKRLKAEFKDGEAVTRVLDAEGKPSAFTTEDLKKELLANKQFAPILVASKGSGGGANRPGGGGADTPKKPNFATASIAEIKAWNESQGVGTETYVRPGVPTKV